MTTQLSDHPKPTKTYTVEITQLVPNFTHITVEATSIEEAIAKAKDEASTDDLWKLDWECVRPDIATGVWEGAEAYAGAPQEFSDSETFEQASKAALELPDDKKRELAWKLLDNLGISVIVALDVDDFIEDRAENGLPEISKAEIIEAIGEVAQRDWSNFSTAAREAVEATILEKLDPANA